MSKGIASNEQREQGVWEIIGIMHRENPAGNSDVLRNVPRDEMRESDEQHTFGFGVR